MGDWERRQLCPDGACIGVIGADGKCTVCGKEGTTEGTSDLGPRASAGHEDEEEAPRESDPLAEVRGPRSEAPASDDPDWSQRKLCPDGGCVGVLGDDGKCSVCGRSAA